MAELSEQDIRRLTEEALKQLGADATPQNVEKVVRQAVGRTDSSFPAASPAAQAVTRPGKGNRIIITAFGKNQIGILAALTGVLAENQCDIIDLPQKILQEFFTIMLLVDISGSKKDFEGVKTAVVRAGEKLDLKVIIQHEEIFNAMHRV
ncbi:MAG TPA: ACT domain-containing protein [Calditrichaeota bacterium]|nr:ACT domain-containing protein [Calditrichota bacterium]